MKKVFSILLALAMAVLCLFGAFANEDTGRAYELPSSQGVIPPTEEEILAGEQKACTDWLSCWGSVTATALKFNQPHELVVVHCQMKKCLNYRPY